MSKEAIILINPACSGGKGWRKWLSIRDDVYRQLHTIPREVVLEKGLTLEQALPMPAGEREVCLVSAGGDGSVHYLVNHLMMWPETARRQVTVGAIGLGSSNDFLKPFCQKIGNIPVLLNIQRATLQQDAGLARFADEWGVLQQKYFVVNASFGVTAEANWKFNNPGRVLQFLKKNAAGGAIVYTAVSTILGHQNRNYTFTLDEEEFASSVSNINVLKSPFVSGSFRYGNGIAKDDGRLHFKACLGMSGWELLRVLHNLQKGIFNPSQKTMSAAVQTIRVAAATPFVFECDGETTRTTAVAITILPKALNVLTS